MSRRRGAVFRATLAVAAAGTLICWRPVAGVPAAGAQEAAPPEEARSPDVGWLGVGLISRTECPAGPVPPGDECRTALVVGGVVRGGPADRAGLEPGDTLLAVDGSRLTGGSEDRALRGLVPGDTVSVLVGRAGGRTRVRAVPAPRPDSLAVVRYHRDGADGAERVRYLLAVPRRPVLDSLLAASARDPSLTVGAGVRLVPTRRVKEIPLRSTRRPEVPEPARERLAEVEARARQLGREAAAEARELRRETKGAPPPDRAEARRAALEEWRRWVAAELHPRLQAIYDSVLAEARARMDSLRSPSVAASAAARSVDSLAAREAPSPPTAARPGATPVSPGWGDSRNRIAGAELQELNPELAAFFGGVERGLVVLRVLPGTPADRLGIRPGDVIVEAAGRPVATVGGLRRLVVEHGEGMGVRWVRRGETMTDTLRH